ncbi:Holliday junction ATP-dependent DNA helicase RuvA [hydrothermal vent metagenome]|uniref:Holliday junction ATP-dependent DNA helicase RuvA n=1 Tax=hydrothermal vent metagenome TaxID=652676 RepID=A0A3B0SCA7_9ZZZZ
MIGRLRGVLVDRGTESIVLDVGGVGYQVAVTPRTLVGLPGIGEEVVLHTHLHVREDQLALFGFDTVADKALFSMLLGVSGIGPKVGLAILATMTPEQLQIAVVSDDVTALTAVPGIGKRSAEKLMVELRPKMEVDFEAGTASGPLSEVREALVGLGYGPDEIRGTLADMPQDLTVADMLKRSLQQLGRATS